MTESKTTASISRWQRVARVWRRWRRRLALVLVAALLVPVLISLSFNFVQPITTSILLQRAFERALVGRDPWMPRREVIGHEAIPPHVRRAVLAAEDDRFYLHSGLDFVEIQKALDAAERGGRLRGASTITQQVAKNVFLWEGRSYLRKGLEAYLTFVLELTLPKDRILDIYLNLAEWGDGVFGIEMAAQRHFGKSASRLTPEEAARLAAILPSPLRWSPTGAVAARRVPVLLDRMKYAAPRE